MNGARHTLFRAEHSPLTARKRWIGGSLTPRGRCASMPVHCVPSGRGDRSFPPA
ncbi:MAG: hypothetical protein CM15mP115_13300 [Alphaproteobacteria bacterium]|nr:MAG: hypothetical protein CM15mP115_13300 [Alphaproteobacteria bacterium]